MDIRAPILNTIATTPKVKSMQCRACFSQPMETMTILLLNHQFLSLLPF